MYEYYGSCSQASLISRTKSDYFYQIRKRTGTNWLMRLESHGIQKGTHIYSFFNYILSRLRRWCGNTFFYVATPMYFSSCRQQTTATATVFHENSCSILTGGILLETVQYSWYSYSVLNTKWKAHKISKSFFPYSTPTQCWETSRGCARHPLCLFAQSSSSVCNFSWDSHQEPFCEGAALFIV